VDLSYEAEYSLLEDEIKGEPELYNGQELVREAKDPNWVEVAEKCEEMLQRSRDIFIFVVWTTAITHRDGYPGLARGVNVLQQNLAAYEDKLFPEIDPSEPLDERYLEWRNRLQSLSETVADPDDPIRFLSRLKKVPIAKSSRMGIFTYEQIEALEKGDGSGPGKGEIEAAFQDSPEDWRAETVDSARHALESVTEMEKHLGQLMGFENAPSFKALRELLRKVNELFDEFQPAAAPAEAASEAAQPAGASGPATSTVDISSVVLHERADVKRALDIILKYYQQNEPTSPVPLFVERLKRYVDMNFLELIEDLHPDSLGPITVLTKGRPKNQ